MSHSQSETLFWIDESFVAFSAAYAHPLERTVQDQEAARTQRAEVPIVDGVHPSGEETARLVGALGQAPRELTERATGAGPEA